MRIAMTTLALLAGLSLAIVNPAVAGSHGEEEAAEANPPVQAAPPETAVAEPAEAPPAAAGAAGEAAEVVEGEGTEE